MKSQELSDTLIIWFAIGLLGAASLALLAFTAGLAWIVFHA